MLNVTIVFHSVCGGTFLLAREFRRMFEERGDRVDFYRVEDSDLAVWQQKYPPAAEVASELNAIPVASPQVLLGADLVILGSPTYFGNVSAEMKSFLDATAVFYSTRDLEGKRFAAFASSGGSEGGAALCLQTLLYFAQHVGMIAIPVPLAAQLAGGNSSAYGIVHHSGNLSEVRPGHPARRAVEYYCNFIVRNMEEREK